MVSADWIGIIGGIVGGAVATGLAVYAKMKPESFNGVEERRQCKVTPPDILKLHDVRESQVRTEMHYQKISEYLELTNKTLFEMAFSLKTHIEIDTKDGERLNKNIESIKEKLIRHGAG